jgi:hypothetical protein
LFSRGPQVSSINKTDHHDILTDIDAPTCGWGNQPSPGHIKKTDDIERIRHIRNFLAHNSKFEIYDKDFSTHWTDLSQVK